MKKYGLKTATWIFLLLFLVGCKGEPPFPTLEHTLQCKLVITKNQMQYETILESPILGSYSFDVTSPPSVQGMKVTIENQTVSYTFEGITHSKEQGAPISLLEQIAGILEQAVRGESLYWEQSREQWTGKGALGDIPFTIVCHKTNNRPVSIKTQDGFTVEFYYE